MLSLDEETWKQLNGGYRTPYDASVALLSMQDGINVWDELWEELHHQGDVDTASYAAIPALVQIAASAASREWNFYGFVSTIEVARHRRDNPAIPIWLKADYDNAWARISCLALADFASSSDQATTCAILGALALAKGDLKLGAMLSGLDGTELDQWLEERLAWSTSYG